MATARCRGALIAAVALGLVVALAGCGGTRESATTAATPRASAGPFSGLSAQTPPLDWPHAQAASGATLPYPRGWRPLGGDPGTVSAVTRDPTGGYRGYLNITPRQGEERQSNWVSFRAAHNRREGDRSVRVLAFAGGVRVRAGAGTCVEDSYTTSTGSRYIELACLIDGAHPAVVLGAAPPARWAAQAPLIARAISSATL
jgi:hypothetical protein